MALFIHLTEQIAVGHTDQVPVVGNAGHGLFLVQTNGPKELDGLAVVHVPALQLVLTHCH